MQRKKEAKYVTTFLNHKSSEVSEQKYTKEKIRRII
jgi:hypothetical protein